jgi:molecular chaperone Hsp33
MISAVAQGEDIYGVAAVTTALVEHARGLHRTSPTVTAALGRLLTGVALMGAWLKEPTYRVALQINCRGPVQRLVAESDGAGGVRGYPGVPTADMPSRHGKLDVGGMVGQGILHVLKEVGGEMPTTGAVPLVSGEIAEDLAAYFVHSEQIPSAVSLGVFVRPDHVVAAAGGFLIQFHATVADDVVDHIERALAQVPAVTTMIQEGYDPQEMLHQALGGLPLEIVRQTTPMWVCQCSRERATRALLAMGREELHQLIVRHEDTQVCCEFCNTEYGFQYQNLEALLAEAMGNA